MYRNVYFGSLAGTLISLTRAVGGQVKPRESYSLLPPVLEPPVVITQYISVLSISSQIAVLSRFVLLLLVCFGCARCIAGAAPYDGWRRPAICYVTASSSSSFTDAADGRYQQFTRSAHHQYSRRSPCLTPLFHPPNALRCCPPVIAVTLPHRCMSHPFVQTRILSYFCKLLQKNYFVYPPTKTPWVTQQHSPSFSNCR